MDGEIQGHLFVSYSHADQSDMLIFRKHLRGMLLNKVQVWSDQDLSKGNDWDSLLKSNLNIATSGLVFATPDYLISSSCRYELQQLSAAKRAGRLRNLFWVQLRPCGWQHTELAEFQAFGAELAINESPDETRRQRAILQVCEQIASEIVRSITDQDRDLAFVRRLLLDAPEIQNVTVNKVMWGEFSICGVGFNGSINVAIKVLKWIPLERLAETLLRIANKRKELTDPSFVPMYNIFQVGGKWERRTVFVSKYMEDSKLLCSELSADRDNKKPFAVGTVVLLLRRMAEGLWELHRRAAGKQEWERTLGLLTPDHVFYDQPAQRLKVPPIGVSSFLWHVLDYETYTDWVDPKSKVYVAPEQRDSPAGRLTPMTDQYMLGRLGVELLEGLRFEQILNGKCVRQFWEDPEGFLGGTWKNDRKHLWEILKKMLEKMPSERFENMGEVVQRLRDLEEEGRALAKSVYFSPGTLTPRQLQFRFFEQFYENFFRASPESKKKFKSVEEQHQKLMMAMAAVHNFRPGNSPTSLDQILDKHRGKGITRNEFESFHESFLTTMDTFVSDQEARKEWNNLLAAATSYMISECVGAPGEKQEHVGDPDSANAYRLLGDKTDVEMKTD
jgi:hemoglobin-like flavoprotein